MRKSELIAMRLTPIQLSTLDALARKNGTNRSATLREILQEYAGREGLWPPERIEPVIGEPVRGKPIQPIQTRRMAQ